MIGTLSGTSDAIEEVDPLVKGAPLSPADRRRLRGVGVEVVLS